MGYVVLSGKMHVDKHDTSFLTCTAHRRTQTQVCQPRSVRQGKFNYIQGHRAPCRAGRAGVTVVSASQRAVGATANSQENRNANSVSHMPARRKPLVTMKKHNNETMKCSAAITQQLRSEQVNQRTVISMKPSYLVDAAALHDVIVHEHVVPVELNFVL
jgi:hypothetical protein